MAQIHCNSAQADPYCISVLFLDGKIATLILQFCFKGQVGPSIFKMINLVPQLLFLDQSYPYIDVMLHNTMR